MNDVPRAFAELQSLADIHLRRILEIPKKHPIHAAALVVVVICEALAGLLGKRPEDCFAEDYLEGRDVPVTVGRTLYDALRNGLAHQYGTKPIIVGSALVIPTLTWQDGAACHLRVLHGRRAPDGAVVLVGLDEGDPPLRLCVNVGSMVADLNALFARLEARLRTDTAFRESVHANVQRLGGSRIQPQGTALDTWREFVASRVVRSLGASGARTEEDG